MGLLRNINENKTAGGPGAIAFWATVGFVLGCGAAHLASLPPGATSAISFTGFGFGIGLGFYAAFGTSDLARVLALPGAVLEQVGELVQ